MGAHILIAEDEMGLRTALCLLLEGEGYQVTAVQDGLEAIDRLRTATYDLLLTDVRMPGLTGLQLLEEVAKLPHDRPEIILFTANGTIETVIEALKHGARDFLLKPFSNEILKLTIQKALHIRELSEENKKMRELERMKKEFIALIAHELSTPLTAIKGYLKLVCSGQTGPIADPARAYLGIVQQKSEQLSNIILKMIDMGKLETTDFQLTNMPLDTSTLVWDVVNEMQPVCEKKQVKLKVDLTAELKPILIDPKRFRQILGLLLDNAITFTAPNKQIHLSVDRWKGADQVTLDPLPGSAVDFTGLAPLDYLQVSVKDEGPGIPEDRLGSLFTSFYQVENLYVRQSGGIGISLSLCKRLVEVMGGRIWVKSRIGEGCCFSFILPWLSPARHPNP